jgi:hypothetical protein
VEQVVEGEFAPFAVLEPLVQHLVAANLELPELRLARPGLRLARDKAPGMSLHHLIGAGCRELGTSLFQLRLVPWMKCFAASTTTLERPLCAPIMATSHSTSRAIEPEALFIPPAKYRSPRV